MYSCGSRAARARGFVALFAVLAMGLGLMASPAEAAPFAYVTNINDSTVSVIDTATNPPSVVATVPVGPVGNSPHAVAVAPDGKRVYVTNELSNNVSVIDTTTNPPSVVATVAVGSIPGGVAVPPDGKHAYVAKSFANNVSVIDTTTNPPSVVATVLSSGNFPNGVAVTPDGKHVYVTNGNTNNVTVIDTTTNPPSVVNTVAVGASPFAIAIAPDGKRAYVENDGGTVSVIDTASNMVVGTPIPVGALPQGVAVTPDGKRVYVTNELSNNVSVIDTTTNPPSVTATVAVGKGPVGVAITPDGKHAYVTNSGDNTVSVIDTTTNPPSVVATVAVGVLPGAVGIVPPPPGVPFLAFNAKLQIDLDRKPNKDLFALESSFTLSSNAPAINPVTESVTLQVGPFTSTLPPGSFKRFGGVFTFVGVIGGVRLEAVIAPTGTLRYAFLAAAKGANLAGTKNPVYVTLTIGDDSGATSVKALIF